MARPFNRSLTVHNAEQKAARWADRGQERAAKLHRNAPRGGPNRNKFGRLRSRAGEPPAPETGDLLERLQAPPERISKGYAFPVNYGVLEHGYRANGRVLEPRPLGRIVLSNLRNDVRNRRIP